MIDSSCWKLYISKLSEDVYVLVYLASRKADSKLDVLYTETPTWVMVVCQRISEEIRTMEQLEGDENPALYK